MVSLSFNLEQLRALVTTADKGSFSAAARALGKAQSAVSTAIANLELDLDLVLFDRSLRAPRLTQQGEAVVRQARIMLEQASQLQSHAMQMSRGEEAKLTLAIEEPIIGPQVDQLLVSLEQRFPKLQLELLCPAGKDIIQLVQSGRVDIGILVSAFEQPDGYQLRLLGQIASIAVAAPQHPLCHKGTLSADDLMQYREMLLTSRIAGDQPRLGQMSHQVWKIESQFALLEMVKLGLGWAWVPEHLAAPEISSKRLQRLEMVDETDRFHLPIDMLISHQYQAGLCGEWLFESFCQLAYLRHHTTNPSLDQ